MSIVEEKKAVRQAAVACRDRAHTALGGIAPARLFANFKEHVRLAPRSVVSGYWPGRSELDIRPLMESLHVEGHTIGLPVVVGRGKPLAFRAWQPGAELQRKKFGLNEPPASAEELTPSVLLVPLLAFDREGYRIGYGAGYYDMTLAELRARAKPLAIGVGYAAQRVERLPRDEHDQRLDWVVTEEYAERFDLQRVARINGVK